MSSCLAIACVHAAEALRGTEIRSGIPHRHFRFRGSCPRRIHGPNSGSAPAALMVEHATIFHAAPPCSRWAPISGPLMSARPLNWVYPGASARPESDQAALTDHDAQASSGCRIPGHPAAVAGDGDRCESPCTAGASRRGLGRGRSSSPFSSPRLPWLGLDRHPVSSLVVAGVSRPVRGGMSGSRWTAP